MNLQRVLRHGIDVILIACVISVGLILWVVVVGEPPIIVLRVLIAIQGIGVLMFAGDRLYRRLKRSPPRQADGSFQ